MSGLDILYVDDDGDIRTIVAMSLALDPAMSVRMAASGPACLAMLAAGSRPDAVLLDLMMPGMDGLQVLDRLRSEPATADIPVIFMTAKGGHADAGACRSRGAVGVILKPFDPLRLAAEVRALLA